MNLPECATLPAALGRTASTFAYRPGADALFEWVLSGSSLLVAGVLGVLAWRRQESAYRWAMAALALAFFTFSLLHAVQALGPPQPSPTPAKGVAALAGLGSAALILWLLPRILAVPTLHQVQAEGAARLSVMAGDLEAKEQAHAAERHAYEARSQNQKMEAMRILAGGLAHDFNNLLGAMAGNVELALMEARRQGPVQPHLEALDGLLGRCGALVQQVLAYCGRGQAQIASIDLNQQVADLTRLMQASLGQKAVLRLEPVPNLPALKGDLAQIRQVIANLVLNAAEAVSPGQGVITIRTGSESLDPAAIDRAFKGQDLEPGPHVSLEVADNGPGLPAEVRERIFDPFFTTKFLGRGLGLSAIHGIVQGHRGGILVASGPEGTSFKVLFPADPGAEVPALEETPTFEEALDGYRGAGTILVVDDEEPLRAMAVKALQCAGFDTLEAGDGLEALQVFEAARARIRLVLLDLTMPRMDGEEAYRVLRRSGILVPVILSSGFAGVEALQHFQGRGIAGFLQKPYRLRTLMVMIRRALEGSGTDPGPGGRAREPLPWTLDLETGDPVLDLSHHQIVTMFNRLVEAGRNDQPAAAQRTAFLVFRKEMLAHFGVEDSLMARTRYPREKAHQATHTALLAQLDDLALRGHPGQRPFTPAVLDFLECWLVHHMQEEDMHLGRFLKDPGH